MAARPEHHEDATTALAPGVENSARAVAYRLVVLEGPDEGKSFTLDGSQASRVLLGQSPACEIKLADPRVSRRHAAIEQAGRRLRLTDLESTNGTFVDGISVMDCHLRGGEVVRIGSTALRVDPLEDAPVVPLSTATRFGRTVGASEEMRRLYPLCEKLAASSVTCIIEGETGTGKEVLAESLHEEGPRKNGPFVVFDCTAVPANLVESELFGHEKGSFTGAIATHRGVFEQAHGGTLLIDEIGDLEYALQAKLLRALERSTVKRVGGDRPIPVDVRVLAATRRNLDQEVAAGRFRDDLFFRLAVARIELPPLRRRQGDIAVLASYFWRVLGRRDDPMPYELVRRYEDYSWPGNLRELHNAVARQLALGGLAQLETMRPAEAAAAGRDFMDEVIETDLPLAPARQRVIDEFERRYLERVLERHGGNIGRAAEASGVARRYFQLLRAKKGKG